MSTILFSMDESVHPPKLYPDYKSTVLRAPSHPMIVLPQGLSEMSGPVFGDYQLGEYVAQKSPRIIIISKK